MIANFSHYGFHVPLTIKIAELEPNQFYNNFQAFNRVACLIQTGDGTGILNVFFHRVPKQ